MLYSDRWTLEGKDRLKLYSWADGQNRAGIPTFNLLVGMREGLSVIDKGYLLPHDAAHPSPRGHEITARSSAQYLVSQEPLRSTGS